MEVLVHPMAQYIIALTHKAYGALQKESVAGTIRWIDLIIAGDPKSDPQTKPNRWQRSFRIEPPAHDSEAVYMANLRITKTKNETRLLIDADFIFGNDIAYDDATLLVNQNLLPFAIMQMLENKFTRHREDHTNPPLLLTEIVSISPEEIRLPAIPVTGIRHRMYGDYIGYHMTNSWETWDQVRPQLIAEYGLRDSSPIENEFSE